MVLIAQNRTVLVGFEQLQAIYSEHKESNFDIKCKYPGDKGATLARYQSIEQVKYVLEALAKAYEMNKKTYYFPGVDQVTQRMAGK